MNLRTLALASALLLLAPAVGVASSHDTTSDMLDGSAETTVWVTDVVLAELPQEARPEATALEEERLVEGHTTFATLEARLNRSRETGSINVTGYVECRHEADVRTHTWNGPFGVSVPIPTRVERAGAECRIGETIVVTPSVFDSTASSPPTPTGREYPVETPLGVVGAAREYVFTHNEELEDGSVVAREYYAWTTPVLPTWAHTDGRPKNLWMPLPLDRLQEMGVHHFTLRHERELDGWPHDSR